MASCIIAGATVASTLSWSVPARAAMMSAAPPASVHHGVTTGPGHTPFTRTPCGANSSDSAFVRFISAALAAE